ncbi:MAG TPA: nucleotide disphospho-sugar-binding domain-containing protein [Planctomycetaceae bacterium]|nr:nucleotide disphospho-sugar-binding domain-containing protein [Planctomycetaceae bacterium]
MHFILVFNATAGDAIPVIGIADRLQQRGHDVVVLGNGAYRPLAAKVAVEFVDIVSVEENVRRTAERDRSHNDRVRGGLRNFITDIDPVYHGIISRLKENTVVAAHGLCLGARVARETHSFPLATLHTTTPQFFSASDPDGWHRDVPAWLRSTADFVMSRALNWALGRKVDVSRAKWKLPPAAGKDFRRWSASPDCVIGLFPEWFAPQQPEWPKVTELVGFPLPRVDETEPLSGDLQAFLDDGPPPLVCSHSSALSATAEFFHEVMEVARQLKQRAALLTSPEMIDGPLPAGVRVFPRAAHSRIYPHAAVAVNHAGMGSASTGLRAGVPQFHAPFAYDQPEVAHRCQRLGVSRYLKPGQFTARRAIPLFEELLHDETIKARCREVAQWSTGYDGLDRACDVLERLGRS